MVSALLAACSSDAPVPPTNDCAAVVDHVETLRWKRVDALVADLEAALALDGSALCQELGALDCAELYRLPLGGSDPFGATIYHAPAAPMNTTPVVVERLALAACSNRAALDAAGAPQVFTHVDLSAAALGAGSPGVNEQVDELYRRLLARDPSAEERAIVASLAEGSSGRDFAALACFTIASSTELLFF
jgi:hypothetical protein